jgi:isopentenyl phosphate kinase
MNSQILFLKLGGSLITDKGRERTARVEVIRRLCAEIADARKAAPGLRLVLGHGSGSFGHVEAAKYGTAGGVRTAAGWQGFLSVWRAADELNGIVMRSLAEAGVPAIRMAPSAWSVMENGELTGMPAEPVRMALDAGLVPVVYGDAVLDRSRGGGIASTEMVFALLARALHPAKILLAGIERGVYADYPAGREVRTRIRAGERGHDRFDIQGSPHADVTGGMQSKVQGMLALILQEKDLKALVFSGKGEGAVRRALLGEEVEGTWLEK